MKLYAAAEDVWMRKVCTNAPCSMLPLWSQRMSCTLCRISIQFIFIYFLIRFDFRYGVVRSNIFVFTFADKKNTAHAQCSHLLLFLHFAKHNRCLHWVYDDTVWTARRHQQQREIENKNQKSSFRQRYFHLMKKGERISDGTSETVGFIGVFECNLLIFDDVLNVSGHKIYNLREISSRAHGSHTLLCSENKKTLKCVFVSTGTEHRTPRIQFSDKTEKLPSIRLMNRKTPRQQFNECHVL